VETETETTEKCYVVVRNDMPTGYQMVQACHAVAEHEKEHPGSMAGRTMIVLSVPNRTFLTMLYEYLKHSGAECTMFWEPDVAAVTALAVSPGQYYVLEGMPLAGKQV
jgi:peptidyl-tRNA hydrolase